MIGKSIGKHKILTKLGQGGMGSVYEAEDTDLGRKVAIKVLNSAVTEEGGKELERFEVEAKVQANLNHPNIVTLYNFDRYGDSYYIVMEYVQGRTLSNIIRTAGPLPPSIVVTIAKQVLEGLSAAHRMGVIHRDLKPSNIIVTPDGVAKVMDFGVAKVQGGKSLTASGAVVGTVAYMSPEQVRAELIDARSDLYSFGIILFELLTGTVPFKDDSDFKIMVHHLHTPAPPPTQLLPQTPGALEDVVLRCLAKNPSDRFQSADQVLGALDAFEEQERTLGQGSMYGRRALAQWLAGLESGNLSPQPAPIPDSPRLAPPPPAVVMGPPPLQGQRPEAFPTMPPLPPPVPMGTMENAAPRPHDASSKKRTLLFLAIVVPVILAAAAAGYYTLKYKRIPLLSWLGSRQQQQGPTSQAGMTQLPPGAGSGTPQSQPQGARPADTAATPTASTEDTAAVSGSTAPSSASSGTRSMPAMGSSAASRQASSQGLSARPSSQAGTRAQQNLDRAFLVFMDLDQSGEKLAVSAAQGRIADILQQQGYEVMSSSMISSSVRAALDRGDLTQIQRQGIGQVILGTAHGSLEPRNAYGTTYYAAKVDVRVELVRASNGKVAAAGTAEASSRGYSNPEAALTDALLQATTTATHEMMKRFRQ